MNPSVWLAVGWLGLALAAPAAMIHRFDAAAPGQTASTWRNDIGTANFTLLGTLLDTNVTSANTILTAAYRLSASGAGVGGALLPHPFNGAGTTTFELWVRPGTLTTNHECIFETGGGQNGTSILITETHVRVLNSQGDVRNHDLVAPLLGIDRTDFIQIVVVLDRTWNQLILHVKGAGGGSQQAISTTLPVNVAGSNGTSLFTWGSGTGSLGGGVTALGGRTDGSATNLTPAGLTQFRGEIARIQVYDTALTEAEVQAAFDAVAARRPQILSFSVNPTNAAPGQAVTLSWAASPFAALSLEPEIGPVNAATTNGLGAISVTVQDTTVFTLTAANGPSTTRARAQVLVNGRLFPIQISEFMADNQDTLRDGDGAASDWIELHNPNLVPVSLAGYALTDDPAQLTKWLFPTGTVLAAEGYLIVFASAKPATNYVDARGFLHATFALARAGEYLALIAPDGTTVVQEFAPAFPPQFQDVSYGPAGYFPNPTPGAPNDPLGVEGFVAATGFSVRRGFFREPFTVGITNATEGATIYYTLDGSVPSPGNGLLYTQPLLVTNTTVLRAAAFKARFQPSKVETHTYLFPVGVLRQPANPPGYPTTWASGRPADYEMDPEIVDHPQYRDQLEAALTVFPTLSLAVRREDVFSATGIYHNPQSEGDAWERPVSAELFFPNGEEPGFQIDAGLRVQGGSSRNPDQPKHSLSLRFRSRYGPAKLRYPLFSGQPDGRNAVDRFDFLQLRAGFNHSWTHRHYYQCRVAQYNRDQWANDLFLEMGQPGSHGRWVHLYINGLYWGMYHVHERPDANYLASYFGGEPEDYDALNSGTAGPGDKVAWNTMYGIAQNNIASPTQYAAIQQWLDLDNLIDYMLLNFYIGNRDWDGHNWRAGRRREPGALYRFFTWDSEFAISPNNSGVISNPTDITGALNTDRTGLNGSNRPSGLHQLLTGNAEYRLRFADRVQRHLFHDGPLSPTGAARIWRRRSDLMDIAVVAESARWGDYKRDLDPDQWAASLYDLYTKNDHYLPTQAYIFNTYLPARTGILLGQLRGRGLYPNTEPPQFAVNGVPQHGGPVAAGGRLGMNAPAGVIYFTLDGTDPRAPGGAVRGQPYTGPFTLERTVLVKARALNGAEWSALSEATYFAGAPASSNNLVISEIYYNPPGPDDATEYLELLNISAIQTLDLTGVRFVAGINFTFPDGARLEPGQRLLLVRDTAAFTAAFSSASPVAGPFGGGTGLNNSGERITLLAGDGTPIRDFVYSDRFPWPVAADGDGYSLVLIQPESNPDHADPVNWRASARAGGSPGGTDAMPFRGEPAADTDGNGQPDLLDYATGSEPGALAPQTARIQPLWINNSTDSYFLFGFQRNLAADDAVLLPEFSTDLLVWNSGPDYLVFHSAVHNGDGTETLFYRATAPISEMPQTFARLRATLRR